MATSLPGDPHRGSMADDRDSTTAERPQPDDPTVGREGGAARDIAAGDSSAERPQSDLVPDAVQDAASGAVGPASAMAGRASQRTSGVTAATAQVRGEATGQLVELGHAARSDDPRHWRALGACIFAAIATAIDPPILQATSSGVQGALRVDPQGAAVIVGLYYLIQAGVMVAGGVFGDLFGIRRVLLIGLTGMLVCSLVTASASTLPWLIVGDVGLSLCTAVVVPLSLAAVMGTFGQRVLPVAIALYLSVQLLAALAAPPMAQLLFDRAGFGATFAPAVLATILAILGARRWLSGSGPGERMSRIDALSLALWSVGMLALVYATVALVGGWGLAHEAAAILGVLCLLWAVSRLANDTSRLHLPHVPFRVIAVTLFTGAILGLTQSGSLLQLSNFLKGVQDFGDIASGVALAPYALATLVASLAVGVVLARRHRGSAIDLRVFRSPIVLGLALVAASLLLLGTIRADTEYLVIGLALGALGAGAAIANVPRTDLLFRSVRSDRVGAAAGLNGSSFLLGEALGNVAVTTMIALSGAAAWQARLIEGGMTQDQAATAYETAQRAVFLETAHPFVEPSYLDVARQVPGWDVVFTTGFTDAMTVLAGAAAIAVVVALIGLRFTATPSHAPGTP